MVFVYSAHKSAFWGKICGFARGDHQPPSSDVEDANTTMNRNHQILTLPPKDKRGARNQNMTT